MESCPKLWFSSSSFVASFHILKSLVSTKHEKLFLPLNKRMCHLTLFYFFKSFFFAFALIWFCCENQKGEKEASRRTFLFTSARRKKHRRRNLQHPMSSNETFIRFFTRCTRAGKEKIENLWVCLGQFSWSWRREEKCFAFYFKWEREKCLKKKFRWKMKWNEDFLSAGA